MVAPRRPLDEHYPHRNRRISHPLWCPFHRLVSGGLGVCVLFWGRTSLWMDQSASRDYFAPEPASGTRPGGYHDHAFVETDALQASPVACSNVNVGEGHQGPWTGLVASPGDGDSLTLAMALLKEVAFFHLGSLSNVHQPSICQVRHRATWTGSSRGRVVWQWDGLVGGLRALGGSQWRMWSG
jgi:hypothetical protein